MDDTVNSLDYESTVAALESYYKLRMLLGALGVLLPFILILGNMLYFKEELEGSMSGYYYTGMRDVFVGTLFAMGLFLLAYEGYISEKDNNTGNLAGIAAIATALFPTRPNSSTAYVFKNYIHLIAAFIFFSVLAYYCLVLFRKTHEGYTLDKNNPKDQRKIRRNKVYALCGWIIILSIVSIIASIAVDKWVTDIDNLNLTLWLESTANIFFGISWLVKSGRMPFFRDL